jgi:phage recombination protein Bet
MTIEGTKPAIISDNGTKPTAAEDNAAAEADRLARLDQPQVPAIWNASAEELAVLKSSLVDRDVTDTEFKFFLIAARHMNLDPFKRQVHIVKYQGKPTLQTGIDGYRALAVRTGKLDGQAEPIWLDKIEGEGGVISFVRYGPGVEGREAWPYPAAHPPFASVASVWRKGVGRPFTYVALYSSFVRMVRDRDTQQMRPMALWGSMPEVMLFKCALSQALRAAFPDELAGVYTVEEMEQAASETRAPVNPEIVTKTDTNTVTAEWVKSTKEDRVRALDWLKAQGYTGEASKSDGPDHLKVLNDFAEHGKHSEVVPLCMILNGAEPVIEGEVVRFDDVTMEDAKPAKPATTAKPV